jgi:hypothetical protein
MARSRCPRSRRRNIFYFRAVSLRGGNEALKVSPLRCASSGAQITLFKNKGGQGVADVAIASKIYSLARDQGIGLEFQPGFFTIIRISDDTVSIERRFRTSEASGTKGSMPFLVLGSTLALFPRRSL